jgi:hypothetical protein
MRALPIESAEEIRQETFRILKKFPRAQEQSI